MLALRSLCFRGGVSGDRDAYDDRCRHVLIEDAGGTLVCCFRLAIRAAARIDDSYSARFYDLSRLATLGVRIGEVGRFCLHPDRHDPDIPRAAFGALAGLVDRADVGLLIGCSSFSGVDPAPHAAAFAMLRARHQLPPDLAPGPRAAETIPLTDAPFDANAASRAMPPLLRSYLAMGARVGSHAVIDRDLKTLHVFTALGLARVPPARVRALRMLASALPR